MENCLWLVMCVDFLCVDHVMSMRGVKGTRAVLNAALAISATKVSLVPCFIVMEDFRYIVSVTVPDNFGFRLDNMYISISYNF